MNSKISSPTTAAPEAESNTATDPFYAELMDWAKARKQQFLRNRVKAKVPAPSPAPVPAKSEMEAWIESWYTPPSLSPQMARRLAAASRSTRSNSEELPSEDHVTLPQVLESKPTALPLPPQSAPQPKPKLVRSAEVGDLNTSCPRHPSGFVVGQRLQLRPEAQRIPEGVPLDAVLVIEEMYLNPYRQAQGIWCIWCRSDSFSGLKSIDSDCLLPCSEPAEVSHPEIAGDLAIGSDRADAVVLRPDGVAYRLVEETQALAEALQPLQACEALAIDTETTGLDPLKDRIRLVQIAGADQPVVIVDLFKVPPEALAPLRSLLQGKSIKVLQNAKFDLKFLQQAGLPLGGKLFDTMVAAQLLEAGVRSHGYNLAELVKVYLGEDLSKEQQRSDWSHPSLSSEQLEYAARDAAILLRLREVMKPKLKNARLVETAKLEFECLEAIVHMELNGMLLDLSRWDSLRQKLEQRRDQVADELRQQFQPVLLSAQLDLLGNEVSLNLDSQQQVLEALQQMGVPVQNTSKLSLIPLAEQYPPVRALLDYRKAAKAVQAFGSSLPKHVHPITGRIHPDYQQMGAATGRMSCRNPNLQQIPRDKVFRSCFIAAPGYRLVVADYSQIELRVAAELSGDRRMIEAYQNDEDLHRLTAALIAGKSLDQVEKSERQAAKAVNFGLIYAMGSKGLAEYAYNNYGVQMSLKQAETFRRRYFEAYQGIARWHGAIKRRLPREMRTIGDRLRRWQDEPKLTELLNTPVQGTAADITKAALSKLPTALKETGARLIGTVHDEILLEAPENMANQAAQILQQVMEQAGQQYLRRVPVKAEVAITLNWAEK
ncbi:MULTISPECIES: bifunctional 3'-5' exonuclease/DNA polymerase [Trichocoleus]|uniref:DNA polymerase I n=1 Tax=Trichocoleus desertorum GB2-A4 TaxID=2933944 RepID=A0ABV0JEL3_9CYAN|nr:bifunctional 3'-5' exonuclease/DNA polymerase [Trichocoleus sp. FACHB-46]MBD1862413.1 bifunctional 3'-5' exonuclease/DNA polymerase [Trichocoleus sp. FACHB-46]